MFSCVRTRRFCMDLPVFSGRNSHVRFEMADQRVCGGKTCKLRNFCHGKLGLIQQFLHITEPNFHDELMNGAMKILLANAICLANFEAKMSGDILDGNVIGNVVLHKIQKIAFARGGVFFPKGSFRFVRCRGGGQQRASVRRAEVRGDIHQQPG